MSFSSKRLLWMLEIPGKIWFSSELQLVASYFPLNCTHFAPCPKAYDKNHLCTQSYVVLWQYVKSSWERLRAGEGCNREWDGWMASSNQWAWVWEKPGDSEGQGQKLGVCSRWVRISFGPLVIWKSPTHHLDPGLFIPPSVVQGKSSMSTGHSLLSKKALSSSLSLLSKDLLFLLRTLFIDGVGRQYDKELSSVQFSLSVMTNYLRPHKSQHARPTCPSQSPRVYSNSCPSSRWCHPAISSSVVPFSSCPQALPAPGSFPMSQLCSWGGRSIGVSTSASVLPMNTQNLSPSGWTGWIALQSKGLSRVFSNTTVQKHQFFTALLSSQSNSHISTWPLEKP